MTNKSALLISLICFIIALVFFTLAYFMFHYLGADAKLHKQFNKQPQKPLVTKIAAYFAVIMFASSVIFLLLGLIAF